MKTILATLVAALGLGATDAGAQTTGQCQDGFRWSGESGTARYEACDGGEALLSLSCDARETISGRVRLDGAAAGPARLDARGSSVAVTLAPTPEGDGLAFDLPQAFLEAIARGITARIASASTTQTLHLRGSSDAIAAMLGSCATSATEATPADADPDPDAGGAPLATGTASDADVIAAFEAAWSPVAPVAPDPGAPAEARCDALAGGPVAGDDAGTPVRLDSIDPAAALVACRDAMEAAPQAPRHAWHAARAHLAGGDAAAAIALIRQASAADYPPAMNALAIALLTGRATAVEGDDTADLLSRAAEANYAPALANLAAGGTGAGPLADHAVALDFARQAAERADPVAATLLGNMAFYGTGMPDDPDLAARWLKVGAARGDPDALVALADVYGSTGGPSEAYRDAAIAAGHRTAAVSAGLYAPGSVSAEEMVAAIAADPIRDAWDDGLLYLGDGRDSDGALFWTLMWPRRSADDWAGGAVDLDPLLEALAGRYDCGDGRLYKITEARLGCAR